MFNFCRLFSLIIVGLFQVSLVICNTETIRLTFNPLNDSIKSNGIALRPSEPQVISVHPQLHTGVDHFIATGLQSGNSYEVKVSWPASFPLAFALSYDDTSGGLEVVWRGEWYSHLAEEEIFKKDESWKYEIAVEEVVFGVPQSMLGVAAQALGVSLVGYWISGKVVEWM